MKINFKKFSTDNLFNDTFLSRRFCYADGDGSDDSGGGGGDDDGSDDDDAGSDDDDEGGEADEGLMNAGDDSEKGDADSGKTIDFKTDKGTEKLNVPDKFWDKDGDKLNEGAVLKTALEAGKELRTLKNQLAEAKKDGPGDVDKTVPETVEAYLENSKDEESPFIKDGMVQLGPDAKNITEVPIDDPVIKLFAEVAKEEGMSQERFERIVKKVLAGVDANVPEENKPLDLEAEAEKFGPNARAVAGSNKAWAATLLDNGEISSAEHVHLTNMGKTAVGLSVVNKLRIQGGGKAIPLGNTGGVGGELPSKAEWQASMPNHRTDPVAYEKWSKQGEEIWGTGKGGSSENSTPIANSGGSQVNYRNKK